MHRVFLVTPLLATAALSAGLDISPDSLRGHVSFLASDLLEGRDTPSRGLDIAAAYIAAQLRRAGLESVTGDDYYQTAHWKLRQQNRTGLGLTIRVPDRIVHVAPMHLVVRSTTVVEIEGAPVVTARFNRLDRLSAEDLRGAVLAIEIPDTNKMSRRQRRRFARERRELDTRLQELMPSLVLLLDPSDSITGRLRKPVLVDPENPPSATPPVFAVADPELAELFVDAEVVASEGVAVGPRGGEQRVAVAQEPVVAQVAIDAGCG
ncbi:MAG: hypothetical protein GY953_01720, partial [bacterium]|nr:hypothetical protein [bacterium]